MNNIPPELPAMQSFCPWTAQCVQMIDVLDGEEIDSLSLEGLSRADQRQQKRLVRHMKGCAICTVAVHEASQMRQRQQRILLSRWMDDGASIVPSTTNQILAALREETRSTPLPETYQKQASFIENTPVAPASHLKRPDRRWQFSFLVAAILILTTIGIFTRQLAFLHNTNTAASTATHSGLHGVGGATPTTETLTRTSTWSSVIMQHYDNQSKGIQIESYDVASKKQTSLFSTCCVLQTAVDGIAHTGQDIVTQHFDGTQTEYRLLSGKTYRINGQGSNAVWATNDQMLFVDTAQGLIEYQLATNEKKIFVYSLKADKLSFYRNGFLYFTRPNDDAFYRVEIASGEEKKVVARAASRTFWLNPAGDTLYYQVTENGFWDIYQTASDGSTIENPQFFFPDGFPIGYASDYALMVVRQGHDNSFHLFKVSSPSQSSEVVTLSTLLPGIRTLCDLSTGAAGHAICDSSIALAPGGESLVIEAGYADGSHTVWFIDLATRQVQALFHPASQTNLQLVGWAKLGLSGA
ncbi:hypothetical protein [Tengunoibacter tsumagoiensis]|uniref:Uncharacterized protein n=1 Tax=Tengunoibacter tsumagoiensis TaxID=2014871 RepID=A0A402A0R7_9CHLR|nr:hypothetical protein [Tengunoibacter tsumagoiensis]GCE12652.1 hypothetical protein KTT_25110 [Tengunoibacter tsumagoiensis]